MEKQSKLSDIIDEIRNTLISQLGKEKLVSVLLYGSSQYEELFWDLDILIILKGIPPSRHEQDLSFLRTLVSHFEGYTLDFQVFYDNEIESPDLFSLDAHGAFFSRILSNATVIYGENPFTDFAPSEEKVIASLLNRIQRYIFQARQEYLGIGRYVSDKNPLYHQKHIRRVMFDLLLMMKGNNLKNIEAEFVENFPNTFSKKDWDILHSSSDDISDFIGLYEKIYDAALKFVRLLLPMMYQRPNRAKWNEIVFEYLLSDSCAKAVIVVDGLPHLPDLNSFLNLLASWGYSVFFPRLQGTWESGGHFLDHDPTEDIREFSKHLKSGITLDEKTIQFDQISVLGVSFGGLVALAASLEESVTYSIAISPAYAFSAIRGIETLDTFLHNMYKEAYRYTQSDWNRFINDEIFSLEKITGEQTFNSQKCAVVVGENDEQINSAQLRTLCNVHDIPIHVVPGGHFAFHKHISIRPFLHQLMNEKNG